MEGCGGGGVLCDWMGRREVATGGAMVTGMVWRVRCLCRRPEWTVRRRAAEAETGGFGTAGIVKAGGPHIQGDAAPLSVNHTLACHSRSAPQCRLRQATKRGPAGGEDLCHRQPLAGSDARGMESTKVQHRHTLGAATGRQRAEVAGHPAGGWPPAAPSLLPVHPRRRTIRRVAGVVVAGGGHGRRGG